MAFGVPETGLSLSDAVPAPALKVIVLVLLMLTVAWLPRMPEQAFRALIKLGRGQQPNQSSTTDGERLDKEEEEEEELSSLTELMFGEVVAFEGHAADDDEEENDEGERDERELGNDHAAMMYGGDDDSEDESDSSNTISHEESDSSQASTGEEAVSRIWTEMLESEDPHELNLWNVVLDQERANYLVEQVSQLTPEKRLRFIDLYDVSLAMGHEEIVGDLLARFFALNAPTCEDVEFGSGSAGTRYEPIAPAVLERWVRACRDMPRLDRITFRNTDLCGQSLGHEIRQLLMTKEERAKENNQNDTKESNQTSDGDASLNQRIESIRLIRCSIDMLTLTELLQGVIQCSQLKEVAINHCHFSMRHIVPQVVLPSLLQLHASAPLEALELSCQNLRPTALPLVAQILQDRPFLRDLSLYSNYQLFSVEDEDDNNDDDDVFKARNEEERRRLFLTPFLKAVQHHPTLRRLNLDATGISNRTAASLLQTLTQAPCSLTQLELWSNPLDLVVEKRLNQDHYGNNDNDTNEDEDWIAHVPNLVSLQRLYLPYGMAPAPDDVVDDDGDDDHDENDHVINDGDGDENGHDDNHHDDDDDLSERSNRRERKATQRKWNRLYTAVRQNMSLVHLAVYSDTPLHVEPYLKRNQLYTSLMQAMKPQQQQEQKQKGSNVAASEGLLGVQQQQEEQQPRPSPINHSRHATLWPRLLQALGSNQGEGTSVYVFCRETLPTSSLVLAAAANGQIHA